MSRVFRFETEIAPDWIDYNGHMRDSFYGLVFSYAVDALQDEVGFDAAYRAATGCTIYLLEDHKVFLHEVGVGVRVRVETRVLAVTAKRFHLYQQMFAGEVLLSAGEVMEMHVQQHPSPRGVAMPAAIRAVLEAACLTPAEAAARAHPARPLRA